MKVDGKIVDGVHLFVGGRGGAEPRTGLRILEDVPCDELPAVLERLLRFFPRGRSRTHFPKKSTARSVRPSCRRARNSSAFKFSATALQPSATVRG